MVRCWSSFPFSRLRSFCHGLPSAPLLWISANLILSVLYLLRICLNDQNLSENWGVFLAAVVIGALIAIVSGLALRDQYTHPTRCGLLVCAHCLSMVLYALSTFFGSHPRTSYPCLIPAVYLLWCQLNLPLKFHLVPMLASVIVPTIVDPSFFADPIPVTLLFIGLAVTTFRKSPFSENSSLSMSIGTMSSLATRPFVSQTGGGAESRLESDRGGTRSVLDPFATSSASHCSLANFGLDAAVARPITPTQSNLTTNIFEFAGYGHVLGSSSAVANPLVSSPPIRPIGGSDIPTAPHSILHEDDIVIPSSLQTGEDFSEHSPRTTSTTTTKARRRSRPMSPLAEDVLDTRLSEFFHFSSSAAPVADDTATRRSSLSTAGLGWDSRSNLPEHPFGMKGASPTTVANDGHSTQAGTIPAAQPEPEEFNQLSPVVCDLLIKARYEEQVDRAAQAEQRLLSLGKETSETRCSVELMKTTLDEVNRVKQRLEDERRDMIRASREMQLKYEDLTQRYTAAMTAKAKADEDVEFERRQVREMKLKYGLLKVHFSDEKASKLTRTNDLGEIGERSSDILSKDKGSDKSSKSPEGQSSRSEGILSVKSFPPSDDVRQRSETMDRSRMSSATVSSRTKVMRWLAHRPDSQHFSSFGSLENLETSSDQVHEGSSVAGASTGAMSSISNLSHELRTPLTTATSALDILMDEKVKLTESDRMDLIHKAWCSLQSLHLLIDNVLDLDRIQDIEEPLAMKKVTVRRLGIHALRMLELQAKQNHVELLLEVDPKVPTSLLCSRPLLERLLLNLLSNALAVSSPQRRVILRFGWDGERELLQVSVIDQGPGMTPQQVSSALEPNLRESSVKGGLGLGLAICQQLIAKMGGSVTISSEGQGLGTTVKFDLRATMVSNVRASTESTVLLLDPDPLRYRATAGILEYLGLHVFRSLPDNHPPSITLVTAALGSFMKDEIDAHRIKYEDSVICVLVPNTSTLRPEESELVDGCIRSPVDVAEVRSLLRTIRISAKSETSSTISHTRIALPTTAPTTAIESPEKMNETQPLLPKLPEVFQDARERMAAATDLFEIPILVAEDNEINFKLFKKQLQTLGVYNIERARDGVEAVALAETKKFAAIIMDCQMPRLNGFQATVNIRKLPHHVTIPIIALTANHSEETRRQAFASGMTDFFTKPITNEKWAEIIKVIQRPLKSDGQ